jgi:hypothetical protein
MTCRHFLRVLPKLLRADPVGASFPVLFKGAGMPDPTIILSFTTPGRAA